MRAAMGKLGLLMRKHADAGGMTELLGHVMRAVWWDGDCDSEPGSAATGGPAARVKAVKDVQCLRTSSL